MSPKQQQTEIERRQELTEPGFRMLKNLNDQWEKMHPGGAVTPTRPTSSVRALREDIAAQIAELRPVSRRAKKSRNRENRRSFMDAFPSGNAWVEAAL